MKRSLQIKLLLIIVVVLGSLWSLWPTLRMAQPGFAELSTEEQAAVEAKAIRRGLDLKGGVYLVLEVDTASLPEEIDLDEALDRTIEVLRNRIDQFGVSEPVIQKEGATASWSSSPG